MTDNIKKIKALLDDGWSFKFEPETNLIGMYHEMGGKKSVCEVSLYDKDDQELFGNVIADYLNNL